jgi:hypothetical protein
MHLVISTMKSLPQISAAAITLALWTGCVRAFRPLEFSIHEASVVQDYYPAHTLDVPVDHFHNDSRYEPHSNDTFKLRYWFDGRFYRPGGPVLALAGGETAGENR